MFRIMDKWRVWVNNDDSKAIERKSDTSVSWFDYCKIRKDGTFTITAKNLQGFDGYKEVKIPFWSHAVGMKDIVWYTWLAGRLSILQCFLVTTKTLGWQYEAQVLYLDAQGQTPRKGLIDYTATKPAMLSQLIWLLQNQKRWHLHHHSQEPQGFDGC